MEVKTPANGVIGVTTREATDQMMNIRDDDIFAVGQFVLLSVLTPTRVTVHDGFASEGEIDSLMARSIPIVTIAVPYYGRHVQPVSWVTVRPLM